ncbi:MAG: Crp/Fnr family transcriptional regulator [Alphaproteobacteria bacterium]|jgi:CRP-like cAMP-binding protein|nr:Crp/Fnr family transcriptional regulator [Alphaproteobacteria bacterium]MDP6814372.1 Crp/Fnr family transcriptional regulator [Alphaproteobacteria bacterium]
MSLNQEVDLLRSIPLFANIEPSKLKLLAFTSERLTFQEGQSLCHQGDMGDAAFLIVDGSADVIIEGPDGNNLTVAQVGRNAFVGEIAILCEVPRTATITATTKLETLRISKDLFFRLINEFPTMAVEIMRELARRQEQTNLQLSEANRRLRELEGGG